MKSKEIRETFLAFFKAKGHQIVPSAPLVIKNDPTLMFTNAGMNQFKDYFLGNKLAPYKRVADTQKCLRVSGKHNDLEEVGIDTYHHTMFEMLGNWSFGDYFKKEAIEWSWELLTEVYKLPKDRLYVSIFGGDDAEGLEPDNEAKSFWQKVVPDSHILYGSKKDNFWEMGDTGPCGPCTEIHIDLRSDAEVAAVPGIDLVNNDHPQVVEIWNNVFMEFNRLANGSLQKLPAQHVDTGMGFERLCMAIQQKTSNYDTDVFQPIIKSVAAKAGVTYGEDIKVDIALRVIADHIRAIAFTIADGQLPSNNKAGYVIRRILRRAVRYGYTFLGFKEPFLCHIVPILASEFEDVFPELKQQEDFVSKVIKEEESSFLRTLETGLKRLEVLVNDKTNTAKKIDGAIVFELFDTFGFPLDLTALIARENDFTIDEVGFNVSMNAQKERSRQASAQDASDWHVVNEETSEPSFCGYDSLSTTTSILRYRLITTKTKKLVEIVLQETPFYAESGGQVGDTGVITFLDGKVLQVIDTKKENGLHLHIADAKNTEDLVKSSKGQVVKAEVNSARRQLISNNHTATHILHAVLQKHLGNHVAQKGSLVSEELLRFDFSHFQKIDAETLKTIEAEANAKIRSNIALTENRDVPIAIAREMGAMALFGEKYGEFVRVITFDPNFSIELCGGTHVKHTGEIGAIKIISESSVAAGVRRLEAITAEAALQKANTDLETLANISALLNNPSDLVKALNALITEKQKLQADLDHFIEEKTKQTKAELIGKISGFKGVTFIAESVEGLPAEAIKQLSFQLRQQYPTLFLLLGFQIDGKPQLHLMLGETNVLKGLNAAVLIKDLAKNINGGGGGQPFYATAGGTKPEGITLALQAATELVSAL